MKKILISIIGLCISSCSVNNKLSTYCKTVNYKGPQDIKTFLNRNGLATTKDSDADCTLEIEKYKLSTEKWDPKINHLSALKISNNTLQLKGKFKSTTFEHTFNNIYKSQSSIRKSINEFPEAMGDLLMELTAELDRHQSINASVNSSSTE